MAEISTRELAELIGGFPDSEPHALICRVAAERLLQQEHQYRDTLLTLWAVVKAAGGKVAVPNDVLVDARSGVLHMHVDPSIPGNVFEANFDA